jgi:hypothetical protein
MPSRRAAQRIVLTSAVILAIALPMVVALLVTRVLPTRDQHDQHEGGRTFYINQDGDDTFDGHSRDHAWQTLNRVSQERLRPGDRVLIGGRVTGTLSMGPGEAGDARNPVVIESYGASRASIVSDLGIDVRDTAGIAIRNVGIYGSGGDKEHTGISLLTTSQAKNRLTGITLENLDVSGFVNGISIGAEGSAGFSDVQITDCAIHDNRNNGLAIYGPTFDSNHPSYAHTRVGITAVYAYNNSGDPNDRSSNTGNGIVVGSVDTGRIDQSAAYFNGRKAVNPHEGPIGIWAYDSTRITIERSLSYSNRTLGADGDGFGLDQNTTDSVIQYNLSYDNSGAGVLLFGQHNNRSNTRNTVRYNVSVNDSRIGYLGAISLLGGVGGDDNGRVSAAQIYQNTVVVNDNSPVTPAILFLGAVDETTAANNVFSGPLALARRQPSGNLVLRGNDYFSIGDRLIDWDKSMFGTLDEWRRATGSEQVNGASTGIQAAPQLIGPATPISVVRASQLPRVTGFSPGPGSPLVGAAARLSSVGITDPGERDFLGARVTSTVSDIGAIVKSPEAN